MTSYFFLFHFAIALQKGMAGACCLEPKFQDAKVKWGSCKPPAPSLSTSTGGNSCGHWGGAGGGYPTTHSKQPRNAHENCWELARAELVPTVTSSSLAVCFGVLQPALDLHRNSLHQCCSKKSEKLPANFCKSN